MYIDMFRFNQANSFLNGWPHRIYVYVFVFMLPRYSYFTSFYDHHILSGMH